MSNAEICSDYERQSLEEAHAAEVNKKELIDERRHGLVIQVHWLKMTNEISMTLIADGEAREFIIPNESVLDARDHPEVYAVAAGMPRAGDVFPEGLGDG